ncbi:2-dehydro-3-deoxyglucarate aldolase/4-hydroxy-2-oxoheptanedioate aldolase [Rhizobiales bacterium GAS191]|nr:2-dehydro-3-deoxyglucarate aldolase/4-hydroxy-2-oxoheptanedioate aldolase [Rhizobiales bacterium GAS113]SEE26740.1 2-dehydro-3-deoxyglucarate aldolase/4-hydroxy-2-oxoheptanedioate aldolase [Rhizobiales bacterium GAS191]
MFVPKRSSLRYRIDRGDRLGVIWLSLGSVALTEIAARARPDAIVLDLQHGLWDRQGMEAAIGVVPPEIPVMARVAENTPLAIGQALDAGAEGVIVPLVETGKQAARAVKASRYPPLGERSGGGARPLADYVDYHGAAERGIVVAVMIETARGLKNAKKIAATEGVDLVFIGTGDLALSLGTFPAIDGRHEDACRDILAACRAQWTPCGIFTTSGDAAARRRAEGYRMVVIADDIGLAGRGFSAATAAYAASGVPALPAQAKAEPAKLPA